MIQRDPSGAGILVLRGIPGLYVRVGIEFLHAPLDKFTRRRGTNARRPPGSSLALLAVRLCFSGRLALPPTNDIRNLLANSRRARLTSRKVVLVRHEDLLQDQGH